MSEWISINDRLPEDGQMIAACSDRRQAGCICRYCEHEEERLPCLKYSFKIHLLWKDITHWMPLPPSPKDK